VKEKLEDLSQRRAGLESGLEELESTIASVKGKAVNQEVALAALNRFKDIYAKLPPYQRRELIGLVLMKAEVTEYQLRLSFHGRPAAPEVFEKISAPGARASRRAEPLHWLRTRSATRTTFSGFRAGIQPVLSLEVAAAPRFTLAVQAGLESAAPLFCSTATGA
jgi:hypothetical protein